jgi:gp6 baseplate wedge subunit|nr:MAG TPA: Baseplate wedge protein [Caudoviricetes sp.]
MNPIDYKGYRQGLKDFLKADPKYADYDFEAGGIATLLNILAYNAHNFGVYAYMLNNESSIDSAQLQQSVFSKARGLGYLPKGIRASRVEAVVKQTVDTFPTNGFLVMHKWKTITGKSQRTSETRRFSNPDDVYLYDYTRNPNGSYTFHSKPAILQEGVKREWKFKLNESVQYQRFVIKDKTMDIDSLRVYIRKSEDDDGEQYCLADSVFNTTSQSRVFYITTTADGYYEIYFGNNVFGKKPAHDDLIVAEYLSTTGEQGNGCNEFTLSGFTLETTETSSGGSDGESLETVRFNALNHFRRQNRLFHEEDYKSAILSRFRNVQAVNVWGGEEHWQKTYNRVFLSIKPYYADKLSSSAKDDIRNSVLESAKRLGAHPVFVDPEFIECEIDVVLIVDMDKTSSSYGEVSNAAIDAVRQYNDRHLNVFDTYLSDVALNQAIVNAHQGIKSSYTRKRLKKAVTIARNNTGKTAVYFGNAIQPKSLAATAQYGIYEFNIYDDGNGTIYADADAEHPIHEAIGTIDYATGLIYLRYPTTAYTGNETIQLTVTPKHPDVASALNNIVRITKTRVIDE